MSMHLELEDDIVDWRKPITKLEESRARIDELDELIASLINERLTLCQEIGEAKKRMNKPVLDDKREKEVLSRVAAVATDPVIAAQLVAIYTTMLAGSRGLQEKLSETTSPKAQAGANANSESKEESNQTEVDSSQDSSEHAIAQTRNPQRYFPTVTIIGLGLIGGTVARLIRKHSPKTNITAVDSPEVLQKALVEGLIDCAETKAANAAERSSLILLAAPPKKNIEILESIAPKLSRRQLVVDVTSTKKGICSVAEALDLNGADFIGGHPLFGSQKSGLEASSTVATNEAVFCLTPTTKSSQMSVKRFSRWLEGLGLKPVEATPASHDKVLARTSHLVQLIAVALGASIADQNVTEHELKLHGPAFKQLARLMESPPEMWLDLFNQNKEELQTAIQDLVKQLELASHALDSADFEKLVKMFETARSTSKSST
ncbi:MAG TPA: prephenate dehydrogenase/arogenate dehydrogenase family protein [Candidatus Melainabacteria bacterium]|nr:prephenate dehydrogenase/arogenate dehydrogenase family protein [Candidatus Melainabacteria bacterium]HIN66770.1 prephenate dehydrogenase/arogenate dehydrogenase family protein [Candidatus Obscuribacterales bacterium]